MYYLHNAYWMGGCVIQHTVLNPFYCFDVPCMMMQPNTTHFSVLNLRYWLLTSALSPFFTFVITSQLLNLSTALCCCHPASRYIEAELASPHYRSPLPP